LSGDGSLKDDSSGRTIIISQTTASRLKLKANTEIVIYFVIGGKTNRPKFQISGIYNTGLEEYDQKFAISSVLHQYSNSFSIGMPMNIQDMRYL
jgi:lipoprotein-releasing system permease protein